MIIGNIRHKFHLLALIAVLLGATCLTPITSVAADTTFPEEFRGDITMNGAPAPVGAKIIAKIDGVECGSFIITEAGEYGGTGTFDERLVVCGNEDDIGHTITFWINDTQASQTAVYEPGESKELDLSVIQTYTYPLSTDNARITNALNYLRSTQNADGSIGGLGISAWAVMAISAAGENPHDWKVGTDSIIGYLEGSADSLGDIATDWERSILAITAAGENPRNFGGVDYVAKLKTYYNSNQIGSTTLLNDDFWGVLALISAGESQGSEIIADSAAFIKDNQNNDDGWGQAVGGISDTDNTAAAVMALMAAGESPSSAVIINALAYLKTQQQNDGGFQSEGSTNSAVDSWVISAIRAVGQDPTSSYWTKSGNNPVGHLLSLQIADGSFNWTASLSSDPEWMTAYAITALLGKPYPVDATLPVITNLTPASGATVSTRTPTISASYSDAIISGINEATATMLVDNIDITDSATVTASSISYTPATLTSGAHSVRVTVSDKAGNEASQSWSFQVQEVSGGWGGLSLTTGSELPPGTIDVSDIVGSDGVFTEDVTTESEDGKVELIINEGTEGLTKEGEPLEEITIIEMEDPPDLPEDSNAIGLTYDLGPDGATFEPPIALSFAYDPDDIPEGVNEEALVIAMWDEEADEWDVLKDCTVDPVAHTISAPASHFTAFAVLAYTHPAVFTVANLTITPNEVDIGEGVTISVTVTNTGDLSGSCQVTLKINDAVVETKTVEVTGGHSKKVSSNIIKDVAGTYTVGINSLFGSFTVREASPTLAPSAPTLPTPASPPPPPAPPPAEPINWPALSGVIAAGVIAIGLLIFLLARKRSY